MSGAGTSNRRSPLSKWLIHSFFILASLLFIIPLLLVVAISITEEQSLAEQGFLLIPREISFAGYEVILKSPLKLFKAYGVTILVTILGTIAGLLFTAMVGYSISRKDYKYGRTTTLFVFFPMLFSGGLVPFYILVTQYLQLKDSIWALIIPYLLNPFYILIMRGFMSKLPSEIFESAKMDGAGEWRIFRTLVLPLSTPALATLGLFISFAYWNDWWLGLLFIDNPDLVPLQLLLVRVMNTIDFLYNNIGRVNVKIDLSQFPNVSARMAMAVLAAGPMMFVFPFFQKYFVSGLTVGSVKG